MRINEGGARRKMELYDFIISLRKKKKSITEIGKITSLTKQGVSYYLRKYGDIEKGT